MAFLTLVQPTQEPVSLAQMKTYARVVTTTDDELLTELITSARVKCENYCERSFLFQTKRLLMDFFPGYVDFKLTGQKVSSPFVSGSNSVLVGIRYAIVPPFPQVRKILNFQYQDANGNSQTMVEGQGYTVDLDSQPARLTPAPFGTMWPVARVVTNAVQVDYISGSQGQITVSTNAGSATLISDFPFLPRDVGTIITIPGAGAPSGGNPKDFTANIASVDSNGSATLDAVPATPVSDVSVWFDGMPALRLVKLAIKQLVNYWYQDRLPDTADIPDGIKANLNPFRDLRL